MTEQDIKRIVQQEIKAQNAASRFGFTQIPRHLHNGVDSPNISQASVIPTTRTIGSVTMATNDTDYFLGITFKPTRVDFFGGALYSAGGYHSQIIGTCFIGAGNHFQPGTTHSVITGGVTETNVQGCSSMTSLASGGSTNLVIGASEFHIVDCFYPSSSTIKARATITGVTADSIIVHTTLAANWSIVGTWFIS